MKSWTYSIRDANTGDKRIGGSCHAETMEDVVKRVIRQHNLRILNRSDFCDFITPDDRKVYIHVGASAKLFQDCCEVVKPPPVEDAYEPCPCCGN